MLTANTRSRTGVSADAHVLLRLTAERPPGAGDLWSWNGTLTATGAYEATGTTEHQPFTQRTTSDSKTKKALPYRG